MITPGALEEGILTLLVFSQQHASSVAMRITSHPWTNQTNRVIAVVALAHFEQYNQPPGPHIYDLLEVDMRRGEQGKLLKQTVNILRDQAEVIQPNFILDELGNFLASQRMKDGFERALEALHRGDLEEARKAANDAQVFESMDSQEIWLKDPRQAYSFIEQEEDEFFSSGVDAIDQVGVTMTRGTLSVFMASAKKGKSWWLVELGKRGLQHHHSVLHITLENSKQITARRYLQAIFSLTKRETQTIHIPFFQFDNHEHPVDIRELIRGSVLSQRMQVEQKLRSMDSCPPLLIRQFPTSQLTTAQLRAYLRTLKQKYGFKPDLICLDYADLMYIDPAQLRIDTGRLYKELRGIAVEENCVIATASQGNRESDTAKVVDKRHVAEDWSKIGTCDLVLAYSQTSDEHKMGLARVLTAAARNERDRFMVLVSQAYAIGQFCMDSVYMDVDVSGEIDKIFGTD